MSLGIPGTMRSTGRRIVTTYRECVRRKHTSPETWSRCTVSHRREASASAEHPSSHLWEFLSGLEH